MNPFETQGSVIVFLFVIERYLYDINVPFEIMASYEVMTKPIHIAYIEMFWI